MISVVIPTYNRACTIERCINSILNQTYKDIQIVIIDDNSQDDTENIIKNMNIDNLKYIKLKENKGACYARNIGIENSDGQYVAFQDSDDEWFANKLEKQMQYIRKYDLDLVSCRMYQIFNDRKNIFPSQTKITRESIYRNNQISTQTILAKKECFKNDKFDIELPRFQDWDLILRLLSKFKCEIMDDILVNAYIQDNSISKNPDKAIKALEIFLEKHCINKRVKGNYLRLLALYKIQKNERYRKYLIHAFINNPFDKRICCDFMLSIILTRNSHYNFYVKRGRF